MSEEESVGVREVAAFDLLPAKSQQSKQTNPESIHMLIIMRAG